MAVSNEASASLIGSDKFSRVTAIMIVLTGLSFFVSYLVYLPFPSLFDFLGQGGDGQGMAAHAGILFYCLATAGAGFVSWGLMLAGMQSNGLSRSRVLKASAVGIGMLGLMRLGTALFPHAPFDQLRFLPIVECIVFSLVAVKLYKS